MHGFSAACSLRSSISWVLIPAKHIPKRLMKDARDVLPEHLLYLQKDQISINSITYRHSNLYIHVLEIVRLGDANTSAYECAMELSKAAVQKLTPIAVVRDRMGLEDRIRDMKARGKEVSGIHEPAGGYGIDAEGSAVGNLVGLSAPERKHKAGHPTSSRDKPPYDDRWAKVRNCQNQLLLENPVAASVHDFTVYAVNQGIRATLARKRVTSLGKQGRSPSAQTTE